MSTAMALNTFCQRCTSLFNARWEHVRFDYYCWSSEGLDQGLEAPDSTDEVDDDDDYSQSSPYKLRTDNLFDEHDSRLASLRPQFHLNLAEVKARTGACHLCFLVYKLAQDLCGVQSQKSLNDVSEQALVSVSLLPRLTWPNTYPNTNLNLSFDLFRGMRLDRRFWGSLMLSCYSEQCTCILR